MKMFEERAFHEGLSWALWEEFNWYGMGVKKMRESKELTASL